VPLNENKFPLGMCYIIFMSSSVCVALVTQGGYRGWVLGPPLWGTGETCHIFRCFFGTWFFVDGFLFSVKELGLLTNPGHWVRGLDAIGSYMYIVL
jgi:hypothetical protein